MVTCVKLLILGLKQLLLRPHPAFLYCKSQNQTSGDDTKYTTASPLYTCDSDGDALPVQLWLRSSEPADMQTQWDASNSYVQISVTMVMKFKPQCKRLGWTSSLLDISMPSVDHIHNITKLKTVSYVQKIFFKKPAIFPVLVYWMSPSTPHITSNVTMATTTDNKLYYYIHM